MTEPKTHRVYEFTYWYAVSKIRKNYGAVGCFEGTLKECETYCELVGAVKSDAGVYGASSTYLKV